MFLLIGIIANPSSGKDIRRLIANATCFDNMEKVNIIQRIMVVFNKMSDAQILVMDDAYGMLVKAAENIRRLMHVNVNADLVPFRPMLDQTDSTKAARILREMGAKCIIVLGGDGTNRVVAKECGDVPLIPLSTGTNNVFPYMIEGTVAGLAALVAETDSGGILKTDRRKKLNVFKNGELVDIALIDVCVTNDTFVASRAVWDVNSIQELFVTVAKPDCIGMSAIAGSFHTISELEPEGLYLRCGRPAELSTMVAIAPGLIYPVDISCNRIMKIGDRIKLETKAGMLALDGEREVEFLPRDTVEIQLTFDGPLVVNVSETLSRAAENGFFRIGHGNL
ncbi:MAG: ATP-NAD kinase [Clostridia bacterium]|nr:ATP-NAD kinase [Clostridia bacterium]